MATKDVKTSELPKADVLDIQPTQPYPTGSPPDPAAVVARVHPAQETTAAEHWTAQAEENLKAAGVIAGATPYEAPAPPPEIRKAPPKPKEEPPVREGHAAAGP